MAKEKICGIYCIENLVNGKKYIGQSIDIYSRWRQHKCDLRRNDHHNAKLQNAWNKYGEENFRFYIIMVTDINGLDVHEKYYISFYDSYLNGYNQDLGGSSTKFMSEETKEKIRIAKQNLSDETIERMRQAQTCKPIYQIDLCGNIVRRWSGQTEASKKLNINQSAIWECLHHHRLTLYGYIWLFEDEIDTFVLSDYINKNTQAKQIVQMDMCGNIIKIWTSAYSARKFGFDDSSIIKCCKDKLPHYKGFVWKYYNDNFKLTIQN